MIKPIRVLVAGGPKLLREIIVSAIDAQPDLDLVGEALEIKAFGECFHPGQADVVVLLGKGESELRKLSHRVLHDDPHVRCLAVSADGRECSLHEFRPRQLELGVLSPAALVNTIRSAATEEPTGQLGRAT